MNRILGKFVEEMEWLENGVPIIIHGKTLKLKFKLGNVIAHGELRTIEDYESKLQIMSSRPTLANMKKYNIFERAILHDLKRNFNTNFTSDILYDFQERVTNNLLVEAFHFLFSHKIVTEKEVNFRIKNFDYNSERKYEKTNQIPKSRNSRNERPLMFFHIQTLQKTKGQKVLSFS